MTSLERFKALLSRNAFCRKFSLRVHKFSFQWDLLLHVTVCMLALSPFLFTGKRRIGILPIAVWAFYHILFYLGE
jgi:hypothetical protein